jgi:ubiquinone/menaquinone biosynthesis C-methylase UbiE
MNPIVRVFERFADDYDHWFDTHGDVYAEQIDLLCRSIPAGMGQILEIGVGSGRFASRLGIRHGLDPSTRLLAMARDRGVEPVLGEGEFLPYRNGTFDTVLMMTVICFMDNLPRSFHEAFRVTRDGGMLVVAFMEKDGEVARRQKDGHSAGRFLQYAQFLSAGEVTAALAGAGFSGIAVQENLHGLCIVTATKE